MPTTKGTTQRTSSRPMKGSTKKQETVIPSGEVKETPSIPKIDSCGDCKFFTRGTTPRGACRRYPDSMSKEPQDWCGEFLPKT